MDENYNLLPHGVNFQDAIFADTQENRQMFSSLFQFSNCTQGQHAIAFSSDWEMQEDSRVRSLACSSVLSMGNQSLSRTVRTCVISISGFTFSHVFKKATSLETLIT